MAKFKKKIICPICGIEFQADRPCQDRVTCSRKCANIHKSQIVYECICSKCGESFDGNSPNESQCSECRKAVCLTCGKVFAKTKSYSKYCSRECVALDKDLRTRIGIKGSQTKVEKIAAGTFSIQKHEVKSHKCVNCGKIFVSNAPCPRYCNDCKTFICVICGEKFTAQFGTNPKTCSVKCRGLSQRNKLVCEYCGKTFSGASKRRFCSKICSDNFYVIEGNHPNCKQTNVQVTCSICGKVEIIQPYRVRRYKACSRKCLNEWKKISQLKKPVTCICIICGNSFEVHPVWMAKKRKTCSPECLANFRSQRNSALSAAGKVKYKTGFYFSILSSSHEHYDSEWELIRFRQLDERKIKWTKKHGIRIGYWWNNQTRYYVPDILIKSTRPCLEEIKPKFLVRFHKQTQAKLAAGERWCDKRGYDFVVLTEEDLFGNNKSQ